LKNSSKPYQLNPAWRWGKCQKTPLLKNTSAKKCQCQKMQAKARTIQIFVACNISFEKPAQKLALPVVKT